MVTRMKTKERATEQPKDLSRPVSPATDTGSLTDNDGLPTYEGSLAGSAVDGPALSEKTASFTTAQSQPRQAPSGSQFPRPAPHQQRQPSVPVPGYSDQSRQFSPVQSHASQQRQPLSPTQSHSSQRRQQSFPSRPTQNLQPTASAPFQFPVNAPPPDYDEMEDIDRPLAIPQTHPSPAAPFIAAYPPALLSFGIPRESWESFLRTLSAFVSANVSTQALHHATDVANSIGTLLPKRFVKPTMKQIGKIEESARNLNPFGVVRHSVRLVSGTAFRVVGSLLPVHRAIWQKPSTPKERAEVYIMTANKDWFHKRGLHAWLLDTKELAELVGLEHTDLLEAASFSKCPEADVQMDALKDVLGDLQIDPVARTPTASSSNPSSPDVEPVPEFTKQMLELGDSSLWLVLSRENTFQGNGEYIGK